MFLRKNLIHDIYQLLENVIQQQQKIKGKEVTQKESKKSSDLSYWEADARWRTISVPRCYSSSPQPHFWAFLFITHYHHQKTP